jgi:hypothetical protein
MHNRSVFGLSGVAWLLFLTWPTQAAPESASGLEIRGNGTCPGARAVRSAIVQLTSEERRRQLPDRASVRVVDRGKTYDVVVQSSRGKVERSFDDEHRDCERRVRFAAVFAVVTLLPPDIIDEPTQAAEPEQVAPPPPPPPPSTPPPEPAPVVEPLVRLELGLIAELAPGVGDGLRATTLGGELRGALGRPPLSALITIGYAPPQDYTLGSVDGDVTRIPGSVGVRLALLGSPVALAVDGALVAALERFSGANLRSSSTETIVEVGARLGLVVSWPIESGVTPFAGLSSTVFPAPREIEIAPTGRIGRTSPLWLTAVAGLALAL